mgnify:CR=1 FL=1
MLLSDYYTKLSNAIVEMDDDTAKGIAQKIVDTNLDVLAAIEHGIVDGMKRVGDLYEQGEYFIPELLSCAEVADITMEIFRPILLKSERKFKGRIVIGVIEGDAHDIGKNIVALLLQGAGYDVLDLGRDVSAEKFVDGATEFGADIIAISTLMTTTMDNMQRVIDLLKETGKRDQFKVIIGGKPTSKSFANKIGADGYSANAGGALRLVTKILSS